ncbi:hypothetical protein RO3G_00532 [Rhizopus delemar RA 99-880]|uniref:Uncharacterized protein n=1 Tax=Rhizopus delemar (strain RA 99-880 / ATCC MYA-4621 / FGSC 9543 / NRRL 43880) TaxID=246409 RepID=I1BHZ8_RHIO9|nr:hypothetical protein RO3G_00532 [Rhizopus delemar RA 99-880]|eukprot:EIE75828.1 hypothetical protein RO3G_00532 [Rhizopus delemar RA 99-880]
MKSVCLLEQTDSRISLAYQRCFHYLLYLLPQFSSLRSNTTYQETSSTAIIIIALSEI